MAGLTRFPTRDGSHAVGGKNTYGVPVGILVLQSRFPRIPGDVGNADTWPFPVLFRVVEGATPDRIVRHLNRSEFMAPFLDAARDLQRAGVGVITTGCGFLVLFQDEMQAQLDIPLLSSSLLQVPWVLRMLPAGQSVGIMTVESSSLTPAHLRAARIDPTGPVVIAGLETGGGHFTEHILEDAPDLDVERARSEHVSVARRMIDEHPEIGAFVLECTNMPPYAADIADATGRPVYDLTTMVGWGEAGMRRRSFTGYL
jgi:hypothetical protein